MKKFFYALLASAMVFTACSKEEVINDVTPVVGDGEVVATFHFSPYQMNPMKSVVAIGTYCTKIDVYLKDNVDTAAPMLRFHKNLTGENDLGTVNAVVTTSHSYTIYAVAHNGTDTITLSDNIINFPNDKSGEAFYYRATFNPQYETDMTCVMDRIISRFRLQVTDTVPSEITKFRFIVDSTWNKWHLNDYAVNRVEKTFTFNYNHSTPTWSGTAQLMAYNDSTISYANITVRALDANDSIIEEHLLVDVPLKNGYITTFTGTFFRTFSMGFSFVAGDWLSLGEYDY